MERILERMNPCSSLARNINKYISTLLSEFNDDEVTHLQIILPSWADGFDFASQLTKVIDKPILKQNIMSPIESGLIEAIDHCRPVIRKTGIEIGKKGSIPVGPMNFETELRIVAPTAFEPSTDIKEAVEKYLFLKKYGFATFLLKDEFCARIVETTSIPEKDINRLLTEISKEQQMKIHLILITWRPHFGMRDFVTITIDPEIIIEKALERASKPISKEQMRNIIVEQKLVLSNIHKIYHSTLTHDQTT